MHQTFVVALVALLLPAGGCAPETEIAEPEERGDGARRLACGTRTPSDEEATQVASEIARAQAARRASGLAAVTGGVIDVYVHVITSTSGEGAVSSAAIDAQMDVLNDAFSPYGWSFQLVAVDTTATAAAPVRAIRSTTPRPRRGRPTAVRASATPAPARAAPASTRSRTTWTTATTTAWTTSRQGRPSAWTAPSPPTDWAVS